ncbi:SusE domain-containing protein [Flavobacteriaceae sp. LMIT009]
MKHLKKLGYLLIFSVGVFFTACEEDADLLIIDSYNSEITFTNSFLGEYVLTQETAGNIGERFTWNTPDFEIPTTVSFDLQRSLVGDFSDFTVVGSTTGNEIAVTIGDLLGFANELGLDNDPGTENPDTGDVTFRVRAYTGNSGPDVFSDPAALTLFLPEVSTGEPICEFPDGLYGVGHGISQTRWTWNAPPTFVCSGDGVYQANVHLTAYSGNDDGNFRFFTALSDWNSGRNYPYYADAGYTIDANFENAGDGDNNFRFIGTTGTYLLTIDDVNKTITLDDPAAIGSCEFDLLYTVGAAITQTGWDWGNPGKFYCDGNGVYSTYIELTAYTGNDDGNFRFFTADSDWNSGRNFPYYFDAGYTIDANFEDAGDGDNNFRFIGTDGFYILSVDDINKTITLTPAEQ